MRARRTFRTAKEFRTASSRHFSAPVVVLTLVSLEASVGVIELNTVGVDRLCRELRYDTMGIFLALAGWRSRSTTAWRVDVRL